MPKTVQGAQIRGRWRLGEDAIARARARLRDEGAFELEHCAIASAGRFCRRSVGPLQPHAHPRLHPPYSKASCTPEIVAFFPSRTTHPRLPLLAVVCLCCPRLRTIAVRRVSATRLTGLYPGLARHPIAQSRQRPSHRTPMSARSVGPRPPSHPCRRTGHARR